MKYIKVIPTGIVHLRMKSDNLHYSWKKPTTTIHNIILGRLWVDNVRILIRKKMWHRET